MSETINIVEEIDDVDAIIRKNNYKLTADKIKQILSKVLNDPSQSAKRWVWELMQNAKDVKNKFDKVSIEIELSENELGALLLFTLGFGMGTPLLLASVLGSRVLPKAGLWMHQIKVLFAFIMLALALYFIRPLISEAWLQWAGLGLGIAFIAYILFAFGK